MSEADLSANISVSDQPIVRVSRETAIEKIIYGLRARIRYPTATSVNDTAIQMKKYPSSAFIRSSPFLEQPQTKFMRSPESALSSAAGGNRTIPNKPKTAKTSAEISIAKVSG